jgi:hypothetical protein
MAQASIDDRYAPAVTDIIKVGGFDAVSRALPGVTARHRMIHGYHCDAFEIRPTMGTSYC